MITVIKPDTLFCHMCGEKKYAIVSWDREDMIDPSLWPVQICQKCLGDAVTRCVVEARGVK